MPTTAVKVFYSTVATAAQLAVHTKTDSSGFIGNLIRQRHSRCRILAQNVQLSANDGAFAGESVKRYVHDLTEEFANPKSIVFTCPKISHSWKPQKATTTTLNSKKKDRRQQQLFAASPMACAQASHPALKQADEFKAFNVTGIRLESGAGEETGRFRDIKRCVATENRTRISGIGLLCHNR